jgi:hypothetical protein
MLYTFGDQTGPIPLSQLDWNFAQIPAQSNVANTVLNAAQANITSVGTLTGLSVVGNVAITGPVTGVSTLNTSGDITTTGALTATNMYIDNLGLTPAIITGNLQVQGTLTSVNSNNITTGTLTITVGNTIVDANRSLLNGAGIVIGATPTGNLVYSYLNNSFQSSLHFTPISNVAGLNLGNVNNYWNTLYASTALFAGNVVAGNLSANTYVATNVSVSAEISAAGNIYSGSSMAIAGDIAAGGALSAVSLTTNSLSVAGTVNVVGLIASGNVYAAGLTTANITAANVATGNLLNSGNITTIGVSATGAITGDSVSVNTTVSAGGNVTGTNLRTVGQVTATGNVIGGNLRTGGTITATGTITGGNLSTAGTITAAGTITGGNLLTGGYISATGAVLANSASIANNLHVFGNTTINNDLNTGGEIWTTGNITASASGAFVSADAVYARTGNVSAGGYFVGNGRYISGLSTTATAISNPTGWSVTPVGTTLYFNYNGTNVGKLDAYGNFTVTGDVTAFGSV